MSRRNSAVLALSIAIASCAVGYQPGIDAETGARVLSGYEVLIVNPVTVKQSAATKDFAPGWEVLLHKGMVRRLLKRKAFGEVLDRTTSPVIAEASAGSRRALLTSEVVVYDKGSRAARYWIGLGAGSATTRMEFVITNFDTGAELLRFERQGKYVGWMGSAGGTNEDAIIESAGDVVDRLLEELRKNR